MAQKNTTLQAQEILNNGKSVLARYSVCDDNGNVLRTFYATKEELNNALNQIANLNTSVEEINNNIDEIRNNVSNNYYTKIDIDDKETTLNNSINLKANKVDLTSEINRATTKENELDSSLTSEINRAKNKEDELNTSINLKANKTDLDDEIDRATTKENSIQASLSSEITRAKNKESELETNVNKKVNLNGELKENYFTFGYSTDTLKDSGISFTNDTEDLNNGTSNKIPSTSALNSWSTSTFMQKNNTYTKAELDDKFLAILSKIQRFVTEAEYKEIVESKTYEQGTFYYVGKTEDAKSRDIYCWEPDNTTGELVEHKVGNTDGVSENTVLGSGLEQGYLIEGNGGVNVVKSKYMISNSFASSDTTVSTSKSILDYLFVNYYTNSQIDSIKDELNISINNEIERATAKEKSLEHSLLIVGESLNTETLRAQKEEGNLSSLITKNTESIENISSKFGTIDSNIAIIIGNNEGGIKSSNKYITSDPLTDSEEYVPVSKTVKDYVDKQDTSLQEQITANKENIETNTSSIDSLKERTLDKVASESLLIGKKNSDGTYSISSTDMYVSHTADWSGKANYYSDDKVIKNYIDNADAAITTSVEANTSSIESLQNRLSKINNGSLLIGSKLEDGTYGISNNGLYYNSSFVNQANYFTNNVILKKMIDEGDNALKEQISANTSSISNLNESISLKANQTELESEISRAKEAESSLSLEINDADTAIANEVTRATNKETELSNNLNSKQNSLTESQLLAVNSGIDSDKVAKIPDIKFTVTDIIIS